MKKILFFSLIFIIVTSFLLFNIETKPLYADDVTITHKGSITGAGSPNYLNGASDVFISGDYAYVANAPAGALTIFDISDPTNPTHEGAITGAGSPNYLWWANSVFVSGDYAYVTSSADAALTIFDISDPTNPTHEGVITGAGSPNYLDYPSSVFVNGDYAYVASNDDDALTIFDISNPTNPTHEGAITGVGSPNYLWWANSVFVSGDYAYVTSSADTALTIFDISDPTNPTHEGSITGVGSPNYLNSANSVFVSGDYAYVTSWSDDALSIFDISDPTNPTHKGSITGSGPPNYLDYPRSVFVEGDYAFVASWGDDALTIFDISDPTNPTHEGSITGVGSPNYLNGANSVFVSGDYAFVVSEKDGALSIFEISTSPVIEVSHEQKFFDNVSVGSSDSQQITVSNTANPANPGGDLDIGLITITGDNADQFSITSDNVSNQTIAAGDSATFNITHTPTTDGAKIAAVIIPSNDPEISSYEVYVCAGNEVGDFVARFYELCLERVPDLSGLEYWAIELISESQTGEGIGYGFAMSAEYIDKATSNTAFVTMLYNVFLDRTPDAGGLAFWVGQLETMATRPGVLNGFIHSAEFSAICSSYGIIAYTPGIPGFVTRFYTLTLERMPDIEGLEHWVEELGSGTQTGEDIAYGFIFSDEFLAYGHPDSTYVSILYNAFFDRVPDPTGYVHWMALLGTGTTREEVLDSFIHSTEFEGICSSYGIEAY